MAPEVIDRLIEEAVAERDGEHWLPDYADDAADLYEHDFWRNG
jgi:hypothetical protein